MKNVQDLTILMVVCFLFGAPIGAAGAQEAGADLGGPQVGGATPPADPVVDFDNRTAVPGEFDELLLGYANASLPGAPAWTVTPSVEIWETVTDNSRRSSSEREADLLSRFRVGVAVIGLTPQLQLGLNYSAMLRDSIQNERQDGFSHFGFARAHANLVPDRLTLDVQGSAREFHRDGIGAEDPLLQDRSNSTQSFTLAASPALNWRFGTAGYGVARYAFSQFWYDRNTGSLITPEGTIGPISNANRHFGSVQLVFPGSIHPRLLSTIVGTGSSFEGRRALGRFERLSASLNNEFQITQTLSLIAAGGYESLSHPFSSSLSRDGETWQVGGRWRPNPNSSVAVLYGRQFGGERFTAQARYAVTPQTYISFSYFDAITTSQLSRFGGGLGSFYGGGGGAFGGGAFDLNSALASLDAVILPSADGSGFVIGVPADQLPGLFGGGNPIFNPNGSGPFSDGFFRFKGVMGSIASTFGESRVALYVFHSERTPVFAPGLANIQHTGARLHWGRALSENLGAFASAGYSFQDFNDSKFFDGRLGFNYRLSETILLRGYYNYLHREGAGGFGAYDANSVTVALTKRFE